MWENLPRKITAWETWDPEYESHELDEDPLLDLLGRVMVALFWSTIYQICFLRDGLTWSWPSSAAIPCCMTAWCRGGMEGRSWKKIVRQRYFKPYLMKPRKVYREKRLWSSCRVRWRSSRRATWAGWACGWSSGSRIGRGSSQGRGGLSEAWGNDFKSQQQWWLLFSESAQNVFCRGNCLTGDQSCCSWEADTAAQAED